MASESNAKRDTEPWFVRGNSFCVVPDRHVQCRQGERLYIAICQVLGKGGELLHTNGRPCLSPVEVAGRNREQARERLDGRRWRFYRWWN